jgi:hypothetical protein
LTCFISLKETKSFKGGDVGGFLEMFDVQKTLEAVVYDNLTNTVGQWIPSEAEVDGDLGHDERGDDAGDQIHAVVVQYLLPCTHTRL